MGKSVVQVIKRSLRLFLLEICYIILIITGIVLICVSSESTGNEIVVDYTDCTDLSPEELKCSKRLVPPVYRCDCYVNFPLTTPIDGPVTIFYELPEFQQTDADYASSRDDAQLAGMLSPNPSANCGNYSFADTPEGKKPIAPCGAIADTMFNDTFLIFRNRSYLPTMDTDLYGITEDDKKLYKNPSGDLQQAFKNFSKPISWSISALELDTTNPGNNAFQNERFIGWMKTDMKIKPATRINHTGEYEHGIPANNYTLRILYTYPPKRYSGRRLIRISSIRNYTNTAKLAVGIVLLVIGIILCISRVIYNYRSHGKFVYFEAKSDNDC